MLRSYLITADLGQVNDPTAIAVLEWREAPTGRHAIAQNLAAYFDGGEHLPRYRREPQLANTFQISHLERLPLGTAYTAIPTRLHDIAAQLRQRWVHQVWEESATAVALADTPLELLIDATGVGRAVGDIFAEHGLDPLRVTIHGGDQVVRVGEREYRVPKRDLVGAVQAALQARRVKAAEVLPDWPVLRRELQNFKAKISLTGHDSYGAGDDWREGNHDDLVLSVALGVWFGEAMGDRVRYGASFDEVVAAWSDLPRR